MKPTNSSIHEPKLNGIELREEVRKRVLALGFDEVKFARVEPAFARELETWLEAGFHADMEWIARAREKRTDPRQVLPGVLSIMMLGVNYWPQPSRDNSEKSHPAWARYSLYSDYHDTIKPGLIDVGLVLEELCGIGPRDYRYYVDTGPVQERGWAARAGLGFIGKNAMLISRRYGNGLFLAGVLVRHDFSPDEPLYSACSENTGPGLFCGKCRRCLDACPTQAFAAPGVVDARRCVSYQTIENKGVIPRDLRTGIGDRIYGCDTCLEVCPWNRFAKMAESMLLNPRPEIRGLSLKSILELTPERFTEVFRRTAIKRIKLTGLLRNACIVVGNTKIVDCVPRLIELLAHDSSVVRGHAVWALARIGEHDALRLAVEGETDPYVRSEYEAEGIIG